MEKIPINIWDDFAEDEYLEEGEIQKTYAYVENDKISHEIRKCSLKVIIEYINKNLDLNNTELTLYFNDTKNNYDEKMVKRVVEEYGEDFFFKRWEIRFLTITHKRLNELVKELNKANLSYNNIPLYIYSES